MSRSSRRLQVVTNSFKITGLPKKKYYQYDAIEPEIKNALRRIEVFERLQNHSQPDVFSPKVIYDSDAIAYSSHTLISSEFWLSSSANHRADISTRDLRQLIQGGTTQMTPRATIALNLLQLILRQAPNLKYPNNVKAFFCREAGSKSLGGGLEIFKGFFQSVRPALKSLLVNVDTSCGVIYQDGPMIEVILGFLGTSHPRALNIDSTSPDWSKLRHFFKSILVTFTHRKGKKKIASLVPRAGSVEFEREKDGVTQRTTIQAYFREAYNISLKYPDALGVELGRGTIVPVELCIVAPNQRYTRRLPQELTKKMVDFTSEKPKARLDAIQRGIRGAGSVLDYSSSVFVKNAGLEISSSPTIIDGKVLSTPPMQYRPGSQPLIPKFGAWNVVNQQFFQPRNIAKWAVVDYSPNPSRDRPANERFVTMLGKNCQKLAISPPQVYMNGNGGNVVEDLKQAARQATGHESQQPDLILVILPSSAADIRFSVKQHGDVRTGVVTQCVRVDKIARANDQYCNNVAMKINAKLGGVNAVPQSRILAELAKQPFIIMGADVGHPSPGVSDQPSVASLVWSYDPQAMCYEAFTSIQPPRLEPIEHLHAMVKKAIKDFGRPPARIVFFRDGLSEGEYAKVAEKEIQDIKGCERSVTHPKPTLTFIVVGKRHHVRFFPQSDQDADKSGNCPAGFVADQGIGNPIAKDYYLQSHGGLLGTSRPSHYVVIRDENFSNNVDNLQELSFALCHSYARATRSVSIPAPLVCGRAKFHFRPDLQYDDSSASVASGGGTFDIRKWQAGFKGPHEKMSKKMFYM
ncbi:Piwi-domain-containing protein [Paxillus ammoniavirescens]|nr:Piwi-domain-containing protein [Paxillus ammoniavirescens]